MGEAFIALDEYFWETSRDPLETSPDSAFDWIFMMHPDDWALLSNAWAQRPPGWREACAYILGQGPHDECVPLLAEALFDPDNAVAIEAGIGYSLQLLEHEPMLAPPPEERLRLQYIILAANEKHVEEIQNLLSLTEAS